MNRNKNRPENKEFDLNQEKFGRGEDKDYHKGREIELVKKNLGEENQKDEDKVNNNIHMEPADEQQFENNSLDSDNTK
jgi:hypothetical protein